MGSLDFDTHTQREKALERIEIKRMESIGNKLSVEFERVKAFFERRAIGLPFIMSVLNKDAFWEKL